MMLLGIYLWRKIPRNKGGIIPFPASESRSFDPSDPSSGPDIEDVSMSPTFVDPYIGPVASNLTETTDPSPSQE